MKKNENRLRFDRILAISLWPHFFGPPCRSYLRQEYRTTGWVKTLYRLRYPLNISPTTEYFKIKFFTLFACSCPSKITRFDSVICNCDRVMSHLVRYRREFLHFCLSVCLLDVCVSVCLLLYLSCTACPASRVELCEFSVVCSCMTDLPRTWRDDAHRVSQLHGCWIAQFQKSKIVDSRHLETETARCLIVMILSSVSSVRHLGFVKLNCVNSRWTGDTLYIVLPCCVEISHTGAEITQLLTLF